MFETENYLIDPHTAVAVNVYQQYASNGDRETWKPLLLSPLPPAL